MTVGEVCPKEAKESQIGAEKRLGDSHPPRSVKNAVQSSLNGAVWLQKELSLRVIWGMSAYRSVHASGASQTKADCMWN